MRPETKRRRREFFGASRIRTTAWRASTRAHAAAAALCRENVTVTASDLRNVLVPRRISARGLRKIDIDVNASVRPVDDPMFGLHRLAHFEHELRAVLVIFQTCARERCVEILRDERVRVVPSRD